MIEFLYSAIATIALAAVAIALLYYVLPLVEALGFKMLGSILSTIDRITVDRNPQLAHDQYNIGEPSSSFPAATTFFLAHQRSSKLVEFLIAAALAFITAGVGVWLAIKGLRFLEALLGK